MLLDHGRVEQLGLQIGNLNGFLHVGILVGTHLTVFAQLVDGGQVVDVVHLLHLEGIVHLAVRISVAPGRSGIASRIAELDTLHVEQVAVVDTVANALVLE